MRSAWIVLVSLAFCATGCWVPLETGETMRRDIQGLQGDMQAAQKGLAEQQAHLSEQMVRAEEQLTEVSKTVKDLNRAARMTDADFGVQMEQLRKELQELRGQIELANYRLGQIETKLEGDSSLTSRLEALETSLPSTDNGSPAPPTTSKGGAPPKDKAGLIAHGKKLAKQGEVGDARGVFREVIRRWPTVAGTTDDALFHLGELYFKEKKFRSALQEYIQVVEKFGTGKLADDSYYRIGECSMNLGNLEDAQIFFEEIIKNHRKSPLVKNAKRKLSEIAKRLEREKSGKGRSKR